MNEYFSEAINLLRGLSLDMKKQASVDQLKATGSLDEDQVNEIASKFANQSQEATNLATDVLQGVLGKSKSASFGKAVTGNSSSGSGNSDAEFGKRFTDHDAEFMSLDF